MVESVVVTVFPVVFLILFGGGAAARRKHRYGRRAADRQADLLHQQVCHPGSVGRHGGAELGRPPVSREPAGMAAAGFRYVLWVGGFLLLFIGRLGLADSFRIGSPKESTRLKVGGLFQFSRNPMYLGVYATLLAACSTR